MNPADQPRPDAPSDCSPRGLRSHERYAWPERIHASWITDGRPAPPQILDCANLGLGGIGILSPEPVPVGTRGAVLLLGANDCGRLRGIEIVHVRFDPSLGRHLLGARWTPVASEARQLIIKRTPQGPALALASPHAPDPSGREAA